jgi:beta-N-acetylhexosaminidase
MQGASVAGQLIDRAAAAWNAGCDMLLLCNAPDGVDDVLEGWRPTFDIRRSARIARLLPATEAPNIEDDPRYLAGIAAAGRLT